MKNIARPMDENRLIGMEGVVRLTQGQLRFFMLSFACSASLSLL